MKYIVYILESKKLNRFYIGYTTNLNTRLLFHKNAENKKFTAKANDWIVFFTLECKTKAQAMAIEIHIKKMKSRTYILNLLKYPEISEKLLLKYNY